MPARRSSDKRGAASDLESFGAESKAKMAGFILRAFGSMMQHMDIVYHME